MAVREVNPLKVRRVVRNVAFTTTGATVTVPCPLKHLVSPPKIYPNFDGAEPLRVTAGLGAVSNSGCAVSGDLTVTRGATDPTTGLKIMVELEGY